MLAANFFALPVVEGVAVHEKLFSVHVSFWPPDEQISNPKLSAVRSEFAGRNVVVLPLPVAVFGELFCSQSSIARTFTLSLEKLVPVPGCQISSDPNWHRFHFWLTPDPLVNAWVVMSSPSTSHRPRRLSPTKSVWIITSLAQLFSHRSYAASPTAPLLVGRVTLYELVIPDQLDSGAVTLVWPDSQL